MASFSKNMYHVQYACAYMSSPRSVCVAWLRCCVLHSACASLLHMCVVIYIQWHMVEKSCGGWVVKDCARSVYNRDSAGWFVTPSKRGKKEKKEHTKERERCHQPRGGVNWNQRRERPILRSSAQDKRQGGRKGEGSWNSDLVCWHLTPLATTQHY